MELDLDLSLKYSTRYHEVIDYIANPNSLVGSRRALHMPFNAAGLER